MPGGQLPGKCIPLLGWHRETPTLSGTLSGTHLVFKTLPLMAHCLKALPSVALKLTKMAPLLSEHMCTAVNGMPPPPGF